MSPAQHWQTRDARPGANTARQTANKGQNGNSDMTIRLGCQGTKVWLPSGVTATLPFQSRILLADGAMLAATDGSPVDLFFRGRAIDYATAGGRISLLAEAVLQAPRNDYILVSGVSKTKKLVVPAGTLLQFGVSVTAHHELPPGGSTLTSGVSLRDVLILPSTSALTLLQPTPIGPGGITLMEDTIIPEPMLLAGSMVIQGASDLLSALVLDEAPAVNVVVDGTVRESYTPTSQLYHGTVLPWATLLPRGIKLNRHTVVPGGSLLPAATILHPGTSLPPGTYLCAGLVLPGGTLVPQHLVRHLENLHKENDTTTTPSPTNQV